MTTDATRLLHRLAARRRSTAENDTDGIILGYTNTGEPVCLPLPSAERASHVACLAASGAGKTMLIAQALVAEFLRSIEQDPQPTAYLVVDPKGDLVTAVRASIAAQAPGALARCRYLNPFTASDGGGFPFNLNKLNLGTTPVDVRAMQLTALVATVSTARGSQAHLGLGARQVEVLEAIHAAALGVTDPRAHVLLGLDALVLPKGLERLAGITGSVRAQQALGSAKLSEELRASCAGRMRLAYGATDDLERIITAPACVQFSDLLAPGTLTIIDLGQPTGGLLLLSAFWANLLVRLAIEHLLERPSPWHGHHVRVVVDEAHLVAAALSDVAEILYSTGRSRGVSVVLLTQGTVLLREASPSLLQVLLTNTPMKIVGRLAAPDAELLAREQAPGLGVESSRGAVRDQFIGRVTNLADREFFALTPGGRQQFRSVDVDIPTWQQAAEQHRGAIAALEHRYALPPAAGSRVTLDDLAPLPQRQPRAGTSARPSRGRSRSPAPRSRWG